MKLAKMNSHWLRCLKLTRQFHTNVPRLDHNHHAAKSSIVSSRKIYYFNSNTSNSQSNRTYPKSISNQAILSTLPLIQIPQRRFNTPTPTTTNDNKEENGNETPSKTGFWDKMILKYGEQTIYAPDNYNRWNVVPFAVSTNLCLGACYAWSLFNEPLTRELGVIAQSSQDWVLSDVVVTFMGIIVAQGASMALCGKWVERVGARITGVTGALLYGGGMVIGAAGVSTHNLPMMYAGYGLLGGAGMGLAYLPPLATLIRWFPDKRGLATGMAICGFGGGAIFITSIKKYLLQYFFEAPQYVGALNEVNTQRVNGTLQANVDGIWKEVLLNSNSENLAYMGASHLEEGLYLVGTGNTGVAATMGGLGLGYLTICTLSGLAMKVPKPGWKPDSMMNEPATGAGAGGGVEKVNEKAVANVNNAARFVHIDDVMKTPQFWLLWTTFLSTATVGMGLMSCAKDVLQACFASSPAALAMGPSLFAATYVQALSAANLSGRFIWASASDKLSRKPTFGIFGVLGVPLCLAVPYIVASATGVEMSNGPLILFYGSSMLIISFFGGGYSTMPAYESDLFGTKYIGAIHGRMMTASALSGVLGPTIFSKWHSIQDSKAIRQLTEIADTTQFVNKFGVAKDSIESLIENKAVNINKLLEMCPDGTLDPTPYLYDPAFKTMGVVMGVGALANLAVKPVNHKWFNKEE